MESEVLKGNDFYRSGMEHLFKQNNLEYKEGTWIHHIKYDENINENYQYKIIREVTHDGTLFFKHQKMIEMFYELVNCSTMYKPYLELKEGIKSIKYIIGDVVIKSEYDIETNRSYPMMKNIFELPIYCEVNLEDEDSIKVLLEN